ncbi:MAG TPA: phospholipase D-like domain-containing protein [Spirochaetota bacterium]|nr:phospholipase D-like domain-containing protein [Spirochaetota bacterium]
MKKKQSIMKPGDECAGPVLITEQAFSRAAGAALVPGNSIRILRDASENYPAWLDAMRRAEKSIHFESYIIYSDDIGREFAAVMEEKARQGVKVRIIYDWLGALGRTSFGFWKRLRQAGAEVRCYNPPSAYQPLGWLSRDHRKMIAVDGRVAFVSGLCVGRKWAGYPEKAVGQWRDTGVAVGGPAVADIERAFADVWATMGVPLPADEVPARGEIPRSGDAMLRVVASMPNMAGLFRLDQLIAAAARETLWLTDAYYLGLAPYVQSLRSAAEDGVDVRLLVPGTTDIPVLRAVSRAGYQPLLEAGIRIFEWNGPMLHAKTAVADGKWSRIGSSNLNIASWLGNCELDVMAEDENFARAMQEMYLDDLSNSTEIVLGRRRAASPVHKRPHHEPRVKGRGTMGRAGAGFIRTGRALEAAIANRRVLGPAEARIMFIAGLALAALAAVAVLWPLVLAVPFAVLGGWLAFSLIIGAYKTRKRYGRKYRRTGRDEIN